MIVLANLLRRYIDFYNRRPPSLSEACLLAGCSEKGKYSMRISRSRPEIPSEAGRLYRFYRLNPASEPEDAGHLASSVSSSQNQAITITS